MKAMIFAAGLGTRLRPLTNDRPKALVEIDGRTLLEIALARLREFGIREVVINAHYFADKIVAYLKEHDDFGMRIAVSREDVLLDTGGGLKKAAHFFLAGAGADAEGPDEEPILVHNVDVLSTIDLGRMAEVHKANNSLATLAVQDRKTSRHLLFDERMELCGRRIGNDATAELVRSSRQVKPLAFSGVHVISPRLFGKLSEEGVFSIITSYLRLAGEGETIYGFRADQYYWRDLGRPEDLERAAEELKAGRASR
ncbi:MAG: nucleotidyltransferase family protein [Terriglobales bacterium]